MTTKNPFYVDEKQPFVVYQHPHDYVIEPKGKKFAAVIYTISGKVVEKTVFPNFGEAKKYFKKLLLERVQSYETYVSNLRSL